MLPALRLRCVLGECSLGRVLVASSRAGVRAIALADGHEELLDELRGRWPSAALRIADDATDRALLARVTAALEQPARAQALLADLPRDTPGSAFRQRVWQALLALPPGAPTTYTRLAQGLGLPLAVRAVASACAANPLAVWVPCHRVVRSDGSLAGYRWGLARKAALLRREAQAMTGAGAAAQ